MSSNSEPNSAAPLAAESQAADGRAPGLRLSGPWWRQALPFVVGLALIVAVVSRFDFAAFMDAIRRVNHAALIIFAVTFVLSLLVTDTFATREVYRHTVSDVRYKDLIILRAASYLPSIVNHHLGQAWLTYFLSKVYGAPLWRVAGATLLVYATIFGGLLVIAAIALPFNPDTLHWFGPAVGGLLVLGLAYLLVIHLRPKFLRQRAATAPLVEVGVRGHLLLLAYRIPHLIVLFIGNWLPFEIFGVHIPLGQALALIPLVMLVSALPITPQGIGTRDVVSQQLFAAYAVGTASERAATLGAATLSFAITTTLVQLAISPLVVGRAYRLMGLRHSNMPGPL